MVAQWLLELFEYEDEKIMELDRHIGWLEYKIELLLQKEGEKTICNIKKVR